MKINFAEKCSKASKVAEWSLDLDAALEGDPAAPEPAAGGVGVGDGRPKEA